MVTGERLSPPLHVSRLADFSVHLRSPQSIASYVNEEGSLPEVGCVCQLRAGTGVSPRVCRGLPGGSAQPAPLHAPLERTPRWAGPAARPLLRVQAAREAGFGRPCGQGTRSSSQGRCSQGLEGLLQGALSCRWARPPAGRPRATFPLFTAPGPPLLSASNSASASVCF